MKFASRSPYLPTSSAGFSLVEVIVALGIFAFSILTIIGLMGSSLKVTRDNEERIQAANVATILLARYQELLTSAKRGEAPQWGGGFPLPTSPGSSSGSFSSVEMIDNLGNKSSDAEDAAFGLAYLISKKEVASGSPSELVHCALRLQWPANAAASDQPVNTYTATTAFVITP